MIDAASLVYYPLNAVLTIVYFKKFLRLSWYDCFVRIDVSGFLIHKKEIILLNWLISWIWFESAINLVRLCNEFN